MESLNIIFMRLRLCSPIEASRKKERKKGRKLYFFTVKLSFFGTQIDGGGETEVNS